MIHRFYKDEQGWFIDLPVFLELGLGTKANLQMVAGADLMLDELSDDGIEVLLEFSDEPFEGYEHHFKMDELGMDPDELMDYNHPIEIGGYYHRVSDGFQIWLCPVTKFVFGGDYPDNIYLKILN